MPISYALGSMNHMMVEILIKNGADVNSKSIYHSNTIIFHLIRLIYYKKRNIYNKNYTPFHFAIEHNSKELVEMLISKGAKPESVYIYQKTKILISDLPKNVDKNWLWHFIEDFGKFKPKSIDLGAPYDNNIAFVEFNTYKDVQLIISDLNYTKLDNIPIRMVEFKKFDKNACVLINNLDLSIEVSQLHETFSNYGEVLTCKIPLTNNKSNGYGYIQFINIEDAKNAVNDLQAAMIEGQVVHLSLIPSDENPFTSEFEFIQSYCHSFFKHFPMIPWN